MAHTFKYFAACGHSQVELFSVQHSGFGSLAASEFTGKCPMCGQRHQVSRVIQYKAKPSRHICDARCMGAQGKTQTCECSCGGKNHGIWHKETPTLEATLFG